jgi:glucokinase
MCSHLSETITAIQQIEGPTDIQQNRLITPDSGYVVGVDIGGTNLRLALADMTGTVSARWSSSITDSRSVDAVMDLIQGGVEQLLQEASVPRSALRAIAAGAPGVTDVDTGIVIATSYLMGWRDVPFRHLLETALGVPAAVDNDVNLAALGEGWIGAAKGTSDFVFLAIGTGIGAGIVLDGRPYRGKAWSAGEIGYMLLPGTPDKPVERGKPGALEGIIGGEGVKEQWQHLWRQDGTTLPKDLTATEIFDAALVGDSMAQCILNQSARMLAYAIYNISLVLNCSLFVLGGGVGMHPALCDATRSILEPWSARAKSRLMPSALGAEAQLMGAIRLALDTALSHSILPVGAVSKD